MHGAVDCCAVRDKVEPLGRLLRCLHQQSLLQLLILRRVLQNELDNRRLVEIAEIRPNIVHCDNGPPLLLNGRALRVWFEPRDSDGRAVLAERSIGTNRTGAGILQAPSVDPQLTSYRRAPRT